VGSLKYSGCFIHFRQLRLVGSEQRLRAQQALELLYCTLYFWTYFCETAHYCWLNPVNCTSSIVNRIPGGDLAPRLRHIEPSIFYCVDWFFVDLHPSCTFTGLQFATASPLFQTSFKTQAPKQFLLRGLSDNLTLPYRRC